MTEPAASEFVPTWTWLSDWTDVRMVKVSSTSIAAFYQIKGYNSSGVEITPSWMDDRYTIEFRLVSGNTVLYCNTNGNANDDIPFYFANSAVSQQVALNDTVTATHANGSTAYTFTVTSAMLWTSSSTAVPAGSFSVLNDVMKVTIPATAKAGDYYVMEGIATRLGFAHVLNTENIETVTAYSSGNTGNWTLTYLGQVLANYPVTASRRKVHSNFW